MDYFEEDLGERDRVFVLAQVRARGEGTEGAGEEGCEGHKHVRCSGARLGTKGPRAAHVSYVRSSGCWPAQEVVRGRSLADMVKGGQRATQAEVRVAA